jgi:hypothetical protein
MLLSPIGQPSIRHSDGTRYCVQAKDITLTTRQIVAYQRAGTLRDEILSRAQPLIRVFPQLEVYGGTFDKMDFSTLRLAADVKQSDVFHIRLQVDALDASLGEITIAVAVVESPPVVVETSIPQSIMHVLFHQPDAVWPEDEGTDGTDSSDNRIPTEVAPTTPQQSPRPESDDQNGTLEESTGATDTSGGDTGRSAQGSSFFERSIYEQIDEKGTEGWASAAVYGTALLGVAPCFAVSIVKDVQVLSWHRQKLVKQRTRRNNVLP